MVEGGDSLFDLPVCTARTRDLLAETLEQDRAAPMIQLPEVQRQFAVLSSVLPFRKTDRAGAAAYSAVFAKAMADVPVDLFQLACERAAAECRFMPTPVELRGLISKELGRRRYRMGRMQMIIKRHDQEGGPKEIEESVEPGEVKALLDSMAASARAKTRSEAVVAPARPRRSSPPTIQDIADLMGCTPDDVRAALAEPEGERAAA